MGPGYAVAMKRAAAVLMTLLTGCNVPFTPAGPGGCSTDFVPAVEVEIIDAETGSPAAEGVDGRVFDGAYSDSLTPKRSAVGGLLSLAGAGERPGLYFIRLRKPGYRDWVMSRVQVGKDECHVITRTVVARLERAP